FDFRAYGFTPTYKSSWSPFTHIAMMGRPMIIVCSIPIWSHIPTVDRYSFIIMVSFHITAGIDNPHVFPRVLERNTIVVLVFLKVYMVVVLNLELAKVF